MNARSKFFKMYYQLPEKARKELVTDYSCNPKSLSACYNEIINNTKLGIQILKDLGYTDD